MAHEDGNTALWSCWGSNGSGCLGVGHQEDLHAPFLMRANLAELAAADAAADNNTAAAAASDQGSSSSNSDEAAASIGLSRSLRLSAPLRFALISCGGCHTLAVDDYGCVWSWGENTHGQLGHGIRAGGAQAATTVGAARPLLTLDAVLTTPRRIETLTHQTALESTTAAEAASSSPLAVSGTRRCVFVSAGWTHSACVMLDSSASDAAVTTGATAAGMVFTWGDNRYKQLGISGLHAAADAVAPPSSPSTVATPSHTDIPQLVVSLRSAGVDVREVHCGWRHTLFLCAEGRVFSCGDNAHGQGGVGDFAPRATPALITLTPTDGDLGGPSTDRDTAGHAPPLLCAAVAAGWKHSLLLCRDRKRLFAAGSNAFGQLGSLPVDIAAAAVRSVQGDVAPAAAVRAPSRKSAALKVCVPRLVQFPSTVDPESFSIAQIAAGWSHSLVRSTDHRLFGWGRADMGQLSVAPAAIAANAAASSSSLSSSSSSAAAAVATAASLASIDLSKCIPLPMELSLPARERLCPSCSQSSSCSSSTAAAAAPGPSTPVQAEANSNREPMRWIACGSEHSLVVTPHDVFLCGWNEHGNLGQGHARPLEDSFGFSHVAQLHLCTRHNTSVAEHMAPPAATQGSFDSSDANAIASSSAKQFCDGSDSVHLPPIRAVATGGAAVILLH